MLNFLKFDIKESLNSGIIKLTNTAPKYTIFQWNLANYFAGIANFQNQNGFIQYIGTF